MVVVKPYNSDEINVIDLANPGNVCSDLPAGPIADVPSGQSNHGTFFGGRLTVCGEAAEDCFEYDDITVEWKAAQPRSTDRRVRFKRVKCKFLSLPCASHRAKQVFLFYEIIHKKIPRELIIVKKNFQEPETKTIFPNQIHPIRPRHGLWSLGLRRLLGRGAGEVV